MLLLVTVASMMWTQRYRAPHTMDADSYAEGPIGHRALVEIFEARGGHCLVDRRGVYTHATAPVFFIEPSPLVARDGRPLDLQTVLWQRSDRGLDSVVVLPKWDLEHDTEPQLAMRIPKSRAQRIVDHALPGAAVTLRREDVDIPRTAALREWTVPSVYGPRRVALQERQTLRVDDREIEVLLGTDRAALIVRTRPYPGRGSVTVVSDSDLFHNYNVHRADHAQIAGDLLESLDSDALVIDEVMHGHGFRLTLAGIMGRFPAIMLAAHALLICVLLVWAGLRKFGVSTPSWRWPASVQMHLVEPVAAALVGASAASRVHALVSAYVALVLNDAADRLSVTATPVLSNRAAALDEIAERRGIEGGAASLWVSLAKNTSTRVLLRIARDAHRLRARLIEETRNHDRS
jgi:hypothetical protein